MKTAALLSVLVPLAGAWRLPSAPKDPLSGAPRRPTSDISRADLLRTAGAGEDVLHMIGGGLRDGRWLLLRAAVATLTHPMTAQVPSPWLLSRPWGACAQLSPVLR